MITKMWNSSLFQPIGLFFSQARVLNRVLLLIFLTVLTIFTVLPVFAQQFNQQPYYQQPSANYLQKSSAFRQEIARFEITVHREGLAPLSLSQVPRVNQGDVLKVKLLDEAVNGIKLDQSLYDWTLLVAFVNPNRKISSGQLSAGSGQKRSDDKQVKNAETNAVTDSVSQEINFRKKGWYREHVFTVPYDSQPVFFLYPRPNYRAKIENLISKNYNEVRKLGEKTIELAGAYAQIGMFLHELQGVLSGNSYQNNGYGGSGGATSGGYHNYNSYNSYNRNSSYGNYGYNSTYNYNLLVSQSVERLARSFNIQLPNTCWQGGVGYSGGSSYSFGTTNQPGLSPELVSRLQCVAKSVRLEDFDLSVSRLLQQGGILAVAQLQQKYPQLAYWISVAAFAVDFIVKVFKKTPMKIVPTVTSSSDNPGSGGYGNYGNTGVGGYGNSYSPSTYAPNPSTPYAPKPTQPMPKISLFAENQPDDSSFVTAYPIVLHKWQAEPDAEIISLRPPVLMEPCLHAGANILKSTDLTEDQLSDNFTKDYTLTMSSTNGFRKEFTLKKNIGLGGWELNITPQDLQEFPKIQMNLETVIKGTRGFNEIKSPPFFLPIAIGGSWEITPESKKEFTVGGKRTITIKNTLGNCQCLQAVIYKPSFGGQFVFDTDDKDHALQYSPDGKEVSFAVDATNFQAGAGEIELRTYGGEAVKLPLKLHPLPPHVTNLRIGKGDREGIISGERLEQIQAVKINGKRAVVIGGHGDAGTRGSGNQTQTYGNQPSYQNPSQPNYGNQPSYPNQPNSLTPNSATLQLPNNYVPNLQASSPNERVLVFTDANAKLTENTVSIELELEDNRIFPIKQNFAVILARPTFAANENREIEGIAIDNGKLIMDNGSINHESGKRQLTTRNKTKTSLSNNSQFSTINYPLSTIGVEISEISLNIQNVLTDYDFKVENLFIETRLEKSSANLGFNPSYNNHGSGTDIPLPKALFEVLDWKNLKVSFQLSEKLQKMLGGRRLQFRIRDKERGDSDWYSIKQTFVRLPQISSITCTNQMNSMCEMKGASLDYISQVSIDGGQTWYPNSPATLQVQPTQDGQKLAMIPILANKKLLMIKLRDFPHGEGLFINRFNFSNAVKVMKNVGQGNQPIQPNQNPYPMQIQPNTGKSKGKTSQSARP